MLRRAAVLTLVFLASALLTVALSGRAPVRIGEDGLSRLLVPVQRPLARGIGAVRDRIGRLEGYDALLEENRQLREAVQVLTRENARLQALEEENRRLRRLLGLRAREDSLVLVTAEVIGRDPEGLRQVIWIDRGEADGLAPGMAVLHPDGLVGRILSVQTHSAQVLLIIDVESAVSAQVVGSQAPGLVEGRWQLGSRLRMRFIPKEVQLRTGDLVVTSGLVSSLEEPRMPPGIPIGRILTVRGRDIDLYQEAELIPAADLDRLRFVQVVREVRP